MPSIPHSKKKSVMRSRDVSSTRPSSWKGVGAIGITPLMPLVRAKIFLPLFEPACYGSCQMLAMRPPSTRMTDPVM